MLHHPRGQNPGRGKIKAGYESYKFYNLTPCGGHLSVFEKVGQARVPWLPFLHLQRVSQPSGSYQEQPQSGMFIVYCISIISDDDHHYLQSLESEGRVLAAALGWPGRVARETLFVNISYVRTFIREAFL